MSSFETLHEIVIAARNRDSGLALAKQYGFQWQPQPEGIRVDILVNVTPLGTHCCFDWLAPEAREGLLRTLETYRTENKPLIE